MSLIDRLNGLDLPQINDECRTTLDRVLVGRPVRVGKTDILRQLNNECDQCNVSMVDYKMDRYSLIRRSSNMIYKHTDQCPTLRRIVTAYEQRVEAGDDTLDDVLRAGRFFEECCVAQAPQSVCKMIVLVDTRQRYFRSTVDKPVRAYLQCVAYLAMIHEIHLYPFMKAFVLYDPTDLDPLLDSTGVYRLVYRLQATNHNVRLVDNLEAVKRGIVSAHCQRYYSSLVEEFNS